MRWDVVGFVLGWTIRLVALPLALVAAYSCYLDSEGYEFAARTYLIPVSYTHLTLPTIYSV